MAGGGGTLAEHGLDFTSLAWASQKEVLKHSCVALMVHWAEDDRWECGVKLVRIGRKPYLLSFCSDRAAVYFLAFEVFVKLWWGRYNTLCCSRLWPCDLSTNDPHSTQQSKCRWTSQQVVKVLSSGLISRLGLCQLFTQIFFVWHLEYVTSCSLRLKLWNEEWLTLEILVFIVFVQDSASEESVRGKSARLVGRHWRHSASSYWASGALWLLLIGSCTVGKYLELLACGFGMMERERDRRNRQ